MAIDYGEKERAFLETLKEDTGRDLGEWMAAISAQNLAHRNDIIDWLRQQRFMFSKASWLERIHHNGGVPIYAGEATATKNDAPDKLESVEPSPPEPKAEPTETPAAPEPPAAPHPRHAEPVWPGADLDALLATAKAYRPLAHYLLREIAKAIPGARFAVEGAFVSIALTRRFALLAVSPRELRLALNPGQAPLDKRFQETKVPPSAPRIPPEFTHMTVLKDARQLDDGLMAAIQDAAHATRRA